MKTLNVYSMEDLTPKNLEGQILILVDDRTDIGSVLNHLYDGEKTIVLGSTIALLKKMISLELKELPINIFVENQNVFHGDKMALEILSKWRIPRVGWSDGVDLTFTSLKTWSFGEDSKEYCLKNYPDLMKKFDLG